MNLVPFGPLDADSLVLLAVRLRSRGTVHDVLLTASHLTGREPPARSDPLDLRSAVIETLEDGLIRSRGEVGRLSLTESGAVRLGAVMAEMTTQVGRDQLERAYREFLTVNHDFLAAVSAGQIDRAGAGQVVRAGAEDSNSDARTFQALVGRITPALASLSAVLPQFSRYVQRFDRALEKSVEDREWIESPLVDSVHTIWFELHEHLLTCLGLTRSDER